MGQRMIIVGGGGVGRETLEIVRAINEDSPGSYRLHGVVDDSLSMENRERLEDADVRYLGGVSDLPDAHAEPCLFVIGIANPAVRRRIDVEMRAKGHVAATLVHPSATLGSNVRLGIGSIICPGARLTANIVVGRHVQVHVNATVGHDSQLADFVSLYPLAGVGGNCDLDEGATVGSSATVLQGLRLGVESFVGAGSVVVRSVSDGSTVKGVPAR